MIKHLVVIAGEESGDMHAAEFIRELKQRHVNLKITGIGGQHMEQAGAELVNDLARHAVTGFTEVLRNIGRLRKGFQQIKEHLKATKPDLLVLVDFPGFNLRLLKYAKKTLNLRILYYISPQIWAWKPNRIHLIKAYVDRMAVILPFEKSLYEKAGVPVSFVGHPLVKKIPHTYDTMQLRQALNIPTDKRIIALLPGSRSNEIRYLMPVLRETALRLAQQYPDLHFVIPMASSIRQEVIENYLKHTNLAYSLIRERAIDTVSCSDVVVVASGTASLECALLIKPMCIIYKVSWLTYFIASLVMRVKFLGLCNLLQNQMIVPELLQYDCNPEELTRVVDELLTNMVFANQMTQKLQQLKEGLSCHQADVTTSSLIEQILY